MERPSEDRDRLPDDEVETFRGVGVPAKQRTVLEPPDEEETEPEPADSNGGEEPPTNQPGESDA